jgi:uncharacterized alkaline shock family protein YloU
MNVRAGGRLPCGTRLATLIEQVADELAPADAEHQASCSHCQEALGELEEVWGRVRELAREQVTAPYRIVQAVMRRMRAQSLLPSLPVPLEEVVPQLVGHALLKQERGSTRIADSVLAKVVALSLRELPSVEPAVGAGETARGRFFGGATSWIEVAVSERGVVVGVRVTVDYGVHIPSLVGALRRKIVERITQLTGLVPLEVNVLVEDIRLSPSSELAGAAPASRARVTELSAPRRF